MFGSVQAESNALLPDRTARHNRALAIRYTIEPKPNRNGTLTMTKVNDYLMMRNGSSQGHISYSSCSFSKSQRVRYPFKK